jgi:glycolate oxidase
MDVDGPEAEVEHTADNAVELARAAGAARIRRPRDEAERALMWKGRKSAFAAVGRISPNYIVQDGVIPRSEIARVLREIDGLAAVAGLRVANVFHAGDGNLHPLVLYDAKLPGQERLAEELGGDILKMCVRYGGSITGEHGVGATRPLHGEMFSKRTWRRWRSCASPSIRNAASIPARFSRVASCGDRPGGPHRPHPSELTGETWRA